MTCQGQDFDTSGQTNSTLTAGPDLVIAPGQTKTYGIRCQNAAGIWNAWQRVQIIKNNLPPPPTNLAPAAPTIMGVDMSTAAAITATVNSIVPFTIRAIDPDGDQIYYQLDWNNDGVMDQRLPSSGMITSGTPQSTSQSWSTTGSYTLQARTVDSSGAMSAWTNHTITINNVMPPVTPPVLPVVSIAVGRDLIRVGESTTVRVTVTANHAVSCTVYGILGGSGIILHAAALTPRIYNFDTSILYAAQVIEVICNSNVPGATLPAVTDRVRVNVVPVVQEV